MLNQHIVDRSRYGHHGLRSGGRPARPTNRIDGSYTGPGVPVTVSPDRPEPPNTRNQTHALSGWGEAPLVLPCRLSSIDVDRAANWAQTSRPVSGCRIAYIFDSSKAIRSEDV